MEHAEEERRTTQNDGGGKEEQQVVDAHDDNSVVIDDLDTEEVQLRQIGSLFQETEDLDGLGHAPLWHMILVRQNRPQCRTHKM